MTKQSSNSTPRPTTATQSRRWPIGVAVALLVIAGVLAAYWYVHRTYVLNYAEEVARPMEKALVETGGVKKCEGGDNGRGTDNQRPRYEAYFELPVDRDRAISIVQKLATEHGFSLTHASVDNRGPLPVPDVYIDDWFYDHSRPSDHRELQQGQIELNLVVNNGGTFVLGELFCGTKEPVSVRNDAEHSAIKMEVRLPEFKR